MVSWAAGGAHYSTLSAEQNKTWAEMRRLGGVGRITGLVYSVTKIITIHATGLSDTWKTKCTIQNYRRHRVCPILQRDDRAGRVVDATQYLTVLSLLSSIMNRHMSSTFTARHRLDTHSIIGGMKGWEGIPVDRQRTQ